MERESERVSERVSEREGVAERRGEEDSQKGRVSASERKPEIERQKERQTHSIPSTRAQRIRENNKFPPLMQRSEAWTRLAPYKEQAHYRGPSDSIANVYSPAAETLRTKDMPQPCVAVFTRTLGFLLLFPLCLFFSVYVVVPLFVMGLCMFLPVFRSCCFSCSCSGFALVFADHALFAALLLTLFRTFFAPCCRLFSSVCSLALSHVLNLVRFLLFSRKTSGGRSSTTSSSSADADATVCPGLELGLTLGFRVMRKQPLSLPLSL